MGQQYRALKTYMNFAVLKGNHVAQQYKEQYERECTVALMWQ